MLDETPRTLIDERAEAREHLELEKLRIFQPQALSKRLHRDSLCFTTHPRDALADIDRRLLVLVEEPRIEIDLPVGDRDEVGRDVGTQISGLRLRDGQRRERTTAAIGRELRGALEKSGMDVEDVPGISLAPRWPAQQQ